MKCKGCGNRTKAMGGVCPSCRKAMKEALRRVKQENLVVGEVGGAWWVWDAKGNVLVIGEPSRQAALLSLSSSGDEEDGLLEKCYFCHHRYGECVCRFQPSVDEHGDPTDAPGFSAGDFWVTEPNLSVCMRFFVDPVVYYGPEYVAWSTGEGKELCRVQEESK